MTLHLDPRSIIWRRFEGLEPVDPAWRNDVAFWEEFNTAFFASNGRAYNPSTDSNVETWVTAEDRAPFSDMIAALAPDLKAQGPFDDVDMVILAHWLPDLHLGTSVTNFAMHRLALEDCLGFAITDRGLSAPLFAVDYVSKALGNGNCRRALLLVMDQKHLLYRAPEIEQLAPENVAAAMILGNETGGLAYRGYRRISALGLDMAAAALPGLCEQLGLGGDATLFLPPELAGAAPGGVGYQTRHVCAAPFIAWSEHAAPTEDALLVTWQDSILTVIGFGGERGDHAH